MAGDKFNLRVNSWYKTNGTAPGTVANPLGDIVTALINGVPAISGGHIQTGDLTTTILNPNIGEYLNNRNGGNTYTVKPKAYINAILLDDQFKAVITQDGKNSWFEQVGDNEQFKEHLLQGREITKNGYLYIYVSNETENIDVFFDNLQVSHIRGPLVEETHYYPFGLVMSGISSKALKSNYSENRYKYNGKELQNKEFNDGSGLEMYDFGARNYDPQIGRWHVIDPYSSKYDWETPYSYVLNMPTMAIDPDGRYFFGLFGSTSEQRRAARKVAEMTGGEVENTGSKKRIHVSYNSATPNESNPDGMNMNVQANNIYFSNEGVPLGKSARDFISTKAGKKEWESLIKSAWGPGETSNQQLNYITGERKWLDGPLGTPLIDPIDIAAGLIGSIAATAEKIAAQTSNRVFWAGGSIAENAAVEFAEVNGLQTIGMTRAGKNLQDLITKYGVTYEGGGRSLWQRLSTVFAKGATGDAHVFLNAAGISPKSIWLTTEKPILESRGIRIITHWVSQ